MKFLLSSLIACMLHFMPCSGANVLSANSLPRHASVTGACICRTGRVIRLHGRRVLGLKQSLPADECAFTQGGSVPISFHAGRCPVSMTHGKQDITSSGR